MNVRQDAWAEPRARRQQPTCQFKRHAVQVGTKELQQPDVDVAHHRERREEELAELPVRDPGPARRQPLERERINPARPSLVIGNVVGGGVLERESMLHRSLLEPEREQRRIF